MADNNFNRIATLSATAEYASAGMEPPAHIIDIVPGARKAYNEWQKANADGAELTAARKATSKALIEARRSNATAAEVEAAERANAEASSAMTTNAKRAARLLGAFDNLVSTADADTMRQAYATDALEADERARAAYKSLLEALEVRDRAWMKAGAPGRPHHIEYANDLERARTFLAAVVPDFPTDAVREAAER